MTTSGSLKSGNEGECVRVGLWSLEQTTQNDIQPPFLLSRK